MNRMQKIDFGIQETVTLSIKYEKDQRREHTNVRSVSLLVTFQLKSHQIEVDMLPSIEAGQINSQVQ